MNTVREQSITEGELELTASGLTFWKIRKIGETLKEVASEG